MNVYIVQYRRTHGAALLHAGRFTAKTAAHALKEAIAFLIRNGDIEFVEVTATAD